MKFAKISFLCLCIFLPGMAPQLLVAQSTQAAAAIDKSDPRQVLAYRGDAVLTQAAIDAAFSRIPEDERLLFVRDGAKVDQLVSSLLQAETVALDAEKSGFANDPVVRERMRLAARKELATAWLEEQANRLPPADYEAMAYEDYLAHPERYSTEVRLDVSHILIGTESRTEDEALALASDLKNRLSADPSRFDAMVLEYSDDPSARANKGRFRKIRHGQMVKPFEEAAYALTAPGQISDPVKSEFGFHLIRLDQRYDSAVIPFETVKEKAEAQMKAKHMASYRMMFLQKLLQDPVVFPEGSVEIMARRHFGENLEKAPLFHEDGVE